MCYTRKPSVSEDRRMADNRASEAHTKRAGVVESLLGSGKHDRKPAPEHTSDKETVPSE